MSQRYDLMNHLLSGGVDYYWRWRTVRKVPPTGNDPILDVCTGTGDLAIAYWKRGDGQVPVVGTDFTPEMLQIADQKASRTTANSPDDLRFLEADTQELPFEDDTFQIVSVAFGLRNVSDTRRGLREMIRVCRPAGRVAILEFSLPGNPVLRWGYKLYFRYVLPRIGQLLSRNRQSAYSYLPESVTEFPYGNDLAEILLDCGLEQVRYWPLTFGIATLYVGEKPADKRADPPAAESDRIPAASHGRN